ncbi:MAG: phosphate acetyltransferase [Proteobacteria bacterium]|nr:MAG: phosphate acetyltransferase [Pseudomonadota bacterium]
MDLIESCKVKCRSAPKKIVFADAMDTRILRAANRLKSEGLANPVLLGNPFALRDYSQKNSLFTPCLSIVDPLHSGYLDSYATGFKNSLADDSVSEEKARELMGNPLFYGAMMVNMGHADVCVAGNLSTTGDVIRAALKVIGLAEQRKTLSSFFMMLSEDRKQLRVFSDAAVVPLPTVEQLADITIDAAQSFERLTNEKARIAMLSFSTKGSSSHPAAQNMREAYELVRSKAPDLLVDGELQLDAAIVPDVANKKAPNSPLQGNSNVLVFPTLDAGNISYKLAQRMCNYEALGPLFQGLKKPMHDLSRGCSVDEVIEIAVLASCLIEQ